MAHIRRRTLKDGKTPVYLAVWKEHPSAPDQSKSFARKADAERYLVDVQHRLLIGTCAPPQLGRTPFRDVAERYLARSTWRPRTRQSAAERLRHAIAHFADRPIASIRKGDIQSFVAELNLAPSTIRARCSTSPPSSLPRSTMGCSAEGIRAPACAPAGRQPRGATAHGRASDGAARARRRVVRSRDRHRRWARLRQSEATGLTADRIDFLRRAVTVDRQWQQASGSHPGVFSPPKTQASTRVIPADSWILEQLAAHLRRSGTGADGVVIHYDGRPIDAAKFGHYLRMARNRAGLPRTVSFHDSRHFYPSALINAGCSLKQVQLAVGHKSARVTLDVYGHLWPGGEERVRDAIGRVFRPTAA